MLRRLATRCSRHTCIDSLHYVSDVLQAEVHVLKRLADAKKQPRRGGKGEGGEFGEQQDHRGLVAGRKGKSDDRTAQQHRTAAGSR